MILNGWAAVSGTLTIRAGRYTTPVGTFTFRRGCFSPLHRQGYLLQRLLYEPGIRLSGAMYDRPANF